MKLKLITLFAAVSIWLNVPVRAQPADSTAYIDHDISTFVSLGGGFDAQTGKVRRQILDLAVAGSIGKEPLKLERVYNDIGTYLHAWRFNFQWRIGWITLNSGDGGGFQQDFLEIAFPDGLVERLPSWMLNWGGTLRKHKYVPEFEGAEPFPRRLIIYSQDGSKKILGSSGFDLNYKIIESADANGLIITYQYVNYGWGDVIARIEDSSGRWLALSYGDAAGWQVTKVDASDGQWVEYDWVNNLGRWHLSAARYSDGTSAQYAWEHSTADYLMTFLDVRASSGMQAVQYRIGLQGVDEATWTNVVKQEINAVTGEVVATRTQDLHPGDDPATITRADGHSRHFRSFPSDPMSPAGLSQLIDYTGKVTKFWNGSFYQGQITDGVRVEDACGRLTYYEKERELDQITRATLPDGSIRTWEYNSPTFPFYVVSKTDEQQRQTIYHRHANGLIYQINYPDGSNEGWSYNHYNQVTVHRLNNGAHEWFDYDDAGRLLRRWLPGFAGQTHSITYTYYPDGHPWKDRTWTETNPDGHTTTYEYDRAFENGVQGSSPCAGRGLVTKISHPDGSFKSFGYDVYGRKIWEENELRQRTSYTYDTYGRLVSSTDPLTRSGRSTYLLPGNITAASAVTLPSGRHTRFAYDANLRKTEEIVQFGAFTSTAQNLYKIESINTGKVLDIRGSSIENGGVLHQWDYLGGSNQQWTLEDAGNGEVLIRNEGSGRVLDVSMGSTDNCARLHQWEANGAPWQRWAIDQLGSGVVAIRSGHSGRVLDVVDVSAENGAEIQQYDYVGGPNQQWRLVVIGQKGSSTSSDEAHTWYAYDEVGNLITLTQQVDGGTNRVTTFEYDSRNRKTAEHAPEGRTTRWEYDAVGNVIRVVNPDGTDTRKTYDTLNRVVTSTDEMGRVTSYTYWPSGQIRFITDPRGFTYEHLYDASGRLTERKYPAASGSGFGSSESWEYNADGTLAAHYNRSGQKLNYAYDSRNRETRRWWDGSAAPEVNTSYDATGRVTSRSNANGTLSYSYDAAGQVSSETQTNAGGPTTAVTFSYDSDGRRSEMNASSAGWQGYTYDARGQLSALRNSPGDTPFAAYSYYASGQRRSRAGYNGITSDYSYDGAGRLNYLDTFRSSNNADVLLLRFAHDSRDRRTWQLRDDSHGDTYRYQPDSELTEFRQNVYRPDQNFWNTAARTDAFSYDENGNRTSRDEAGTITNYQTDALNQYTAVTGSAISHSDGRGNLTQWQDWTYSYDADNRLTYAGKAGYQVWFYYDAMGRLSKLNRNGQWEHRYYDCAQVILRTQSNGTVIDRTAWGPTPDEVIARWTPEHSWHFYHQDALNSTVAITDFSGNVVERYLYDAYGQEDIRDGNWGARVTSTVGNSWMFTGQELMADLGLNNYKNRFYHADLGRFIQQDPIRFDAGDLNLYRYCGNNPINLSDPTGQNAALMLGGRLVMAGAITTQADSPLPGPADLVGGTIMVAGGIIYGGGRIYDYFSAPSPTKASAAATEQSGSLTSAEKGRIGEALSEAEAKAAGETILGKQPTLELPSGATSRPDLLTKTPDGELKVREAKNGEHARLTTGQIELQSTIESGGTVIPRGGRAAEAGLPVGEPIKIRNMEVDHFNGPVVSP